MSKPESAHKAEQSARESASAEFGSAPARSRGSETKIAMLLVVVLLGALSFVVYRKLNAQTEAVAQSTDFQQLGDDDAAPSQGGSGEPSTDDDPWSVAEQSDSQGAGAPQDPWSVAGDLPQDQPRQQSEPTFVEWGNDETEAPAQDGRSEPTFAQTEPSQAPSSGGAADTWDPFVAGGNSEPAPADTRQPMTVAAADAAAFDPFAGDAPPDQESASEPIDDGQWSSNPASSADPFAASASTESRSSASAGEGAASAQDGPVMELFDGGPQMAETDSKPPQTASAADPWGNGAGESFGSEPAQPASDRSTQTASAEPLLIEPRNPQVVPVAASDPFESDTVEEEQPVVEAESLGGGSDAWDLAADTQAEPVEETAELDFSAEAPTLTFEPDTPATEPVDDPWGDNSAMAESESGTPQPNLSPLDTDPFYPAAGVSTAASEEPVTIHVVASGDSFWSISKEHYGAGRYFNALAAFNQSRIPNPRELRPGMKVMVPETATLQQRYPQLTGGTYSPGQTAAAGRAGFYVERGQPMYRVAKGDTLSGIAHKHLGRASRWIQVYGMNQAQLTSASSLKIGMVLRLPNDASRISAVPASSASR